MPVSKKRKKDGKPVQRKAAGAPGHEGEGPHPEGHPEGHPDHDGKRPGKPRNAFLAQQPNAHRASQRGR